MLVPRTLRLKGVKEKPTKAKAPPATNGNNGHISRNEVKKDAIKTMSLDPSVIDAEKSESKAIRGPRFNPTPVTPEYLAQLAAGIELIFTDYATQEPESAKWLQERFRSIDGGNNYVHLTAILAHKIIATLKPQATQILLRKALQEHVGDALELSSNGYYVRRRPSTYPLPFVPPNSFKITDDDGFSFWDQRTIYVEPHIRHLCKTPAKVAHWLTEHGKLKAKWLPVQAVHTLYNSCAFVVISGNVTHADAWKKWRDTGKPTNWKIMTKVEHKERTEEYLELLKQNNTKIKRQRNTHTYAEPETNFENGQSASKKRKRPSEDVQSLSHSSNIDTNMTEHATSEISHHQPKKQRTQGTLA